MALHEDQVTIELATVRSLVDEQFPQWENLPLTGPRVGGTVNAIFRIGENLAARFPLRRQPAGVVQDWLTQEAIAATEFASVGTVRSPEPVAFGTPGHGYPMPWSVQTWIPGHDATTEDPGHSLKFATDLAELIVAVRATEIRGRVFSGNGRGGHLTDHDDWVETCPHHSTAMLDTARIRELWSELRLLPEVDADAMTHGDLTPANVLVAGGRLTGILDTGGFSAADPALDLVAAWHLLEADPRELFRSTLAPSEITWRRGMAWAFEQSLGLVWYYARSHPVTSNWGRRTLERILATEDFG